MSLGDGITWADWVRLVAAEVGVHDLTDEQVNWLLWEQTAWPFSCEVRYLRPQLVLALIAYRDGSDEEGPA